MTTLFARRVAAAGVAVLALGAIHAPARAQRPEGQVAVRVTGLRSDRGKVRLAVFAGPRGFPDQIARACRVAIAPIRGGQARVVLDRLPTGPHAIAVVHDENGNGKLDTDWLGRPREGVGASNNTPPRRSAPRFEDARFTVTGARPRQEISIRVFYR